MRKKIEQIKKIFSGFSWSRPKWDSIEKSLHIEEKGASDGVSNIPETNDEPYGTNEQKIIDEHIKNFDADDAKLKACTKKTETIYDSLKGNIIKEANTVHNAKENSKNAIGKSLKEIELTKIKEREEYKSLKAFRIANELLGRTAQFKFRSWCLFGVLFFIIIEALLNANFVGQFLKEAWKEALPITIGIAFINVGLSYIAGDHALRQLWHHDRKKQILGGVFFLLWFIVILCVNGAFANYRAALNSLKSAQIPTTQINDLATAHSLNNNKYFPYPTFKDYTINAKYSEIRMDAVKEDTAIGPEITKSVTVKFDFYSGLLLVIGLVFALIGLLDGLLSDDFFPGYGKKVRNYQSPRKKNREEFLKLASIVNSNLSSSFKELFQKKDTSYEAKEIQMEVLEQLEFQLAERQATIAEYERRIRSCLNKYRRLNINGRDKSNKPPTYFSQKYQMDEEKKDLKIAYGFIWEDFGDYLFNKSKKNELKKEKEGIISTDIQTVKTAIEKLKTEFNDQIHKEYMKWIKGGDDEFDPRGGGAAMPKPKIEPDLKVVSKE